VSLSSYSSCLRPDPWLRIAVLNSGRVLVAIGLAVIVTLDLDVALRGAACLVFFAIGRFELQQVERGFDACIAIRLSADGAVALCSQDREWRPGTLQTGSVVLRHFAWLRVRTIDGRNYVELLRGDTRRSVQWRRLQVIWRHIGAAG